jgi:hypothetical protein
VKVELDRPLRSRRPAVGEHVASDLGERGLEEHERTVAEAPPHRIAQGVDRPVEDAESFLKLGKGCVELKGLLIAPQSARSR